MLSVSHPISCSNHYPHQFNRKKGAGIKDYPPEQQGKQPIQATRQYSWTIFLDSRRRTPSTGAIIAAAVIQIDLGYLILSYKSSTPHVDRQVTRKDNKEDLLNLREFNYAEYIYIKNKLYGLKAWSNKI